jgi:hypothetical protein
LLCDDGAVEKGGLVEKDEVVPKAPPDAGPALIPKPALAADVVPNGVELKFVVALLLPKVVTLLFAPKAGKVGCVTADCAGAPNLLGGCIVVEPKADGLKAGAVAFIPEAGGGAVVPKGVAIALAKPTGDDPKRAGDGACAKEDELLLLPKEVLAEVWVPNPKPGAELPKPPPANAGGGWDEPVPKPPPNPCCCPKGGGC